MPSLRYLGLGTPHPRGADFQFSIFDFWFSIFNFQFLIFHFWFLIFDVWFSIFNFWFLIFGFRFSIFDFWFSIFDCRLSIVDFWFSIFDFRFSIVDFRFSIFDFRFSIFHTTSAAPGRKVDFSYYLRSPGRKKQNMGKFHILGLGTLGEVPSAPQRTGDIIN